LWLIAKELKQPLHFSLEYVSEFPHTITFCCRRQLQLDSYMELPKEKRPPESIWDNPEELEDWFDRVFDRDGGSTGLIVINPDEIET